MNYGLLLLGFSGIGLGLVLAIKATTPKQDYVQDENKNQEEANNAVVDAKQVLDDDAKPAYVEPSVVVDEQVKQDMETRDIKSEITGEIIMRCDGDQCQLQTGFCGDLTTFTNCDIGAFERAWGVGDRSMCNYPEFATLCSMKTGQDEARTKENTENQVRQGILKNDPRTDAERQTALDTWDRHCQRLGFLNPDGTRAFSELECNTLNGIWYGSDGACQKRDSNGKPAMGGYNYTCCKTCQDWVLPN